MVENSQVQLTCVAEGVPQPSLHWEKDGHPLTESLGEPTILPSGELIIDSVQVSLAAFVEDAYSTKFVFLQSS